MRCIMCGEDTKPDKVMCPECREYNKGFTITIESVSDIEGHFQQLYAQMKVMSETVQTLVAFNDRLVMMHNEKIRNESRVNNTDGKKFPPKN